MTKQDEKGREVLAHRATQKTNGTIPLSEAHTDNESITTDPVRNKWAHIVAEFDRNIEAFVAYVADVRRRTEQSNGWTGGTDHMRAFIRGGRFITPEGEVFKVTHGYDAVWCREVCRRWPDVAPHILPTLKKSMYDRFYPDLFTDAKEA